jgi:pantothenate kinase type III
MDQFELYLLVEKIKKVPLEAAEIQELNQTPEVQSTMNQMGIVFRPVEDINNTIKRIIENLKENPDIITMGKLFED